MTQKMKNTTKTDEKQIKIVNNNENNENNEKP